MRISPEALGILTDEARRGTGSETLLRTLGPVLDTKLEFLLNQLEKCDPDLSTLLDLRAQITTLRSLKRELTQAVAAGHEAAQRLDRIS